MLKTKRINTGIYAFTYKGREFEVEKTNGGWFTYEMVKGTRAYHCDYCSKAEAVTAAVSLVDKDNSDSLNEYMDFMDQVIVSK